MKRKGDEKARLCSSSRIKLDPTPLDLKMATVTRLPAKSVMKTDQKQFMGRVESKACSGGVRIRKERDRSEDDEKDTIPSKLDEKDTTPSKLDEKDTTPSKLDEKDTTPSKLDEKDTTPSKLDEKDTTPSKLDSLHSDLKMAILTRMPAKSLWKLRCLSKMWSSIVRSQEFVDSFVAMSSTQSRFIVSLSNGVFSEPGEKLTFFFSFPHEGEESSSLAPNFEMAIPVGSTIDPQYLASLHGFLNVYTDRGLLVCNPSTEQVIKLPGYPLQFVGYDPIGGKHKVLSLRPKYGDDSNGHVLHKVLTIGGCQGWRDIEGNPVLYFPIRVGVCINGFIYYGAYSSPKMMNPVIVCFDVRSEKFSFIQAPGDVLFLGKDAILIEYNGKLAYIVRETRTRFHSFDLWILEDAQKHEWSKQTCVFPPSAWDSVWGNKMCFPGTNKAGEIIIVPDVLSPNVQPFYIFYYNVRTNNIRRVRLLGIGDCEEFRRSYGFYKKECYVRVAPQHVDSIAFLKNHK